MSGPTPRTPTPDGLDEHGWMNPGMCIKPCPILGIQWPIIIVEQNGLGNGETSGCRERTNGWNPYTMDEACMYNLARLSMNTIG